MYNANPNYEMNFTILKDVNEHMEGLFQRFSKLLPFRIDFAYRKDTPSFGHSCKHSMCIEIYRLLSETQTMLAGYYWVMEYTPDKGLHIHWICPYISRHLLSLNPLLACCRRYSRGER